LWGIIIRLNKNAFVLAVDLNMFHPDETVIFAFVVNK